MKKIKLVILSDTLQRSDYLYKDFIHRFANEIFVTSKTNREVILIDDSIILFESYWHWDRNGCRGRHDYIERPDIMYEKLIEKMDAKDKKND